MNKFNEEDDALLAELGVEVEKKKATTRTPKEERIIAGFEEIQRFVEENGHTPTHGEGKDIFERLYAVRLERISQQPECREMVEDLDHQEILLPPGDEGDEVANLDDDDILEALGVDAEPESSIKSLKHVRPHKEIKAAEDAAHREACEDFDQYRPLFEQIQEGLKTGVCLTCAYEKNTQINKGEFFILDGLKAYIATVGEKHFRRNKETDRRLLVIFDNGTQSNMLYRSFQRALRYDEHSRRVINNDHGPLFSNVAGEDDLESGTLYVLRSRSKHPEISKNRELIHKVGFTTGSVERRVADAENQATYLLAKVEVVATYKLYNINANRLERLIHRFLEPAKLDIEIDDRFGKPFKPREWFLVPLDVIAEAMKRLQDGSIVDYVYDPAEAKIVKRD